MPPFYRALGLISASIVMAGQGPFPLGLQWPTSAYLACDQSSTDILRVFNSSQRIDAADSRGRPLSMLTVTINRGTKIDSIESTIRWYQELPVERWWETGRPYSFPAQVQYRSVNSAGIVRFDTLSSVWRPASRTLVYTTTIADSPSGCGWTDSIAFDQSYRRTEQRTCEGTSQNPSRRLDRYFYDGSDRNPRNITTTWKPSKSDTDYLWYEGPAESPTHSNLLQVRSGDSSGTVRPSRRLERTSYRYGSDGKLQQTESVTLLDNSMVARSGSWLTWGSNGSWNKLEGFEVETQTSRDSLWWSASCTDTPPTLHIRGPVFGSGAARLARIRGGWLLVTNRSPIAPVEWIGADGTRSPVRTTREEQGIRIDWHNNSRHGWIRFPSSSGVELIPVPSVAP